MATWLHIVINMALVAFITAAPAPSKEEAIVPAPNVQGEKHVAKRAEEMVFFGNQQNEPRVPTAKRGSIPLFSQEFSVPAGQPDEGSTILAHKEAPVEKDLIDRAEATLGAPEKDRMEAMEIAKEKVEEAVKDQAQETKEETTSEPSESVHATEIAPVVISTNQEDIDEDKELASLANKEVQQTAGSENVDSNDESVAEYLEWLREGQEDGKKEKQGDDDSNNEVDVVPSNTQGDTNLNYYQTMYSILNNRYKPGARSNLYYDIPYLLSNRRRRSSLRHKRNNQPIRQRRNRRARRFKRDLPDWLRYDDLDTPVYADDFLLDADIDDPESVNDSDDLTRYVDANLLNTILNYGKNPLYVDTSSLYDNDILEPLLEEYDPEEEYLFDPDDSQYYNDLLGDDSYALVYSKRSSPDYRKRYFYPVYEEPKTHWGAFVPEKRNSYEDDMKILQRLAVALSDSRGPYYERVYRKK